MIFMIILFSIPVIILGLSLILSMNMLKTREKLSPFECGFDPSSSSRIPFSIRFFILMVLFLVFDIEIVLLMPMPLIKMMTESTYASMTMLIFIIILLVGLLHEWKEGSLEWTN